MKDSYFELNFIVTYRAGAHALYLDGNHITLVNLSQFALFIKYRLTSSSGKEIKQIDDAHDIGLT